MFGDRIGIEPIDEVRDACERTIIIIKHHAAIMFGGGSRIRTHGPLSESAVFKTAALNRSAIPPLIQLATMIR